MQGSIRLSVWAGYTLFFRGTLLLLVVILLSLFFYRQIRRFQNNRARKAVNTTVAAELSKKSRQLIAKKVDEVFAFRSCHFPSFTDCRLISEHANLPHVHRMIACDEVLRDVDRQLEAVNADLVRCPGESTYSFLNRIKAMDIIPELSDDFVERLSFLARVESLEMPAAIRRRGVGGNPRAAQRIPSIFEQESECTNRA
ncbi:hypothetical protein M3Y99_01156600 [Aphelenchoides fujianensis]|nr:hypothetical protein M3Y99_01156600 [Aphelenchoides fujianensis]